MAAWVSTFQVRYRLVWAAFALLLLVPLIAMRFTREVNWSPSDFVVAAMLLFGAALGFEVSARLVRGRWQRRAAVGAICVVVLAIWAQGAVGIV
jgi:hypothetical protein